MKKIYCILLYVKVVEEGPAYKMLSFFLDRAGASEGHALSFQAPGILTGVL